MANSVFFNSYFSAILQAQINHLTGNVCLALLNNSYVFNPDSQLHFSDVGSYEVTGTGYTAGGQSLASKALSVDDPDSYVWYQAANVSWPASTISARWGLVYLNTGDPTTSPLMYLIDFGSVQSSGAGTFLVNWDTRGIAYFSGL